MRGRDIEENILMDEKNSFIHYIEKVGRLRT